ncbi:MAG: hypothetical protein GTO63_08125 [Anaerolineae bacterium]|nr:hypothetical protein [Anaerolineae bacterium]NIN94891.1 hypothetical protein [Anaerolineae bacterium]
MDSLDTTCRYLRESVTLLDDPRLMLVALFHLGERLAREGSAFDAWRAVCRADSVLTLMGGTDTQLVTRHRWVKALAFRASGELAAAESELMAVRRDLLSNELVVPSALASLDLASVYAAQQKTEEVKALAQECFAVFTSEGTDSDALVAFMTFYRAAQAETLTEALAVKVANFIARYQHNQSLRYEWSEE